MKHESQHWNWSLGLLLMALVMAVLAFVPIGYEPWSHLAMGRVAETFGTIPDRNLYVYFLDPQVKVGTLEWLGQWWMYKVHDLLGLHGLMALRAALAGLSIGLAVIWGRVPRVIAGVAALGFVVGAQMTPAMFGGAAMVVALMLIVAVAQGRLRSGWLFALSVPVAVLVHIDGVFALIALFALWAAKARGTKTAWIGALVVGLATLVNPRNLEVWWLAARQFHLFGVSDVGSLVLLGLAAGLAYRHTESIAQRVAVIGVSIFGLFRIELAPFAILSLGILVGKPQEASKVPMWIGALALVVAILLQPLWAWWPGLAGALNVGRRSGLHAQVMAQSVPHEAMQIVKSWGGRTTILNTPETAGLWMFELGNEPYPMVFSAPRHLRDLRNQKMVDLTFKDVQVLRGVLHQYNVRAALLPKTGVDEALTFVKEDPQWRMAWEDRRWVLYTR